MRKLNLLAALFIVCNFTAFAQTSVRTFKPKPMTAARVFKLPASKVDFDAFDSLSREVKKYRKTRLVSLADFNCMSKEKNTIILDARSTEMYNRKHVKGAVHLDFSDFTQANLQKIIPTANTRILIYCNNNFDNDPFRFATKSYVPPVFKAKGITLALNIPTFINLYGYGIRMCMNWPTWSRFLIMP